MVTGSRELIREMNRKLVLESIINDGPISRADIAKQLGLTKATISTIVQELIDSQLVEEIGSSDTSFGRKPILLEFCRQNGYVLALDLGVSTTSLMICNLAGQNCRLHQYNHVTTGENAVDFLRRILKTQIQQLPVSVFGVVGISIGIHGTVNKNQIVFTPNYDLSGLDLAEILQREFQIPVWLENEANLAVLAEKSFVSSYKNMIQISIHSGVGAGIILDHNLYTGLNGTAGEFGHTIVVPGGRPCPCGNHGCLEQYISEPAVLEQYRKLLRAEHTPTIDDLVLAYSKEEEPAVSCIQTFVQYLSCGINNLWNLFNPQAIILNCQLSAYIPDIIPMIRKQLSSRFNESCILRSSTLQDAAVLFGGVRISVGNFLHIDKLRLY